MTDTIWLPRGSFACITPQQTPWGPRDNESCASIAGLRFHFVSTPGHGGLFLPPAMIKRLPRESIAAADHRPSLSGSPAATWWEEDCDAAIPIWVLCKGLLLSPDERAFVDCLSANVRNWHPDLFQLVTGKTLDPTDSFVLSRRKFEADNRRHFVARAAWGDWAAWVPHGMMGVVAARAEPCEEGYFLVPEADYGTGGHRFVVDPDRHHRVEKPADASRRA